MATFNRYMVLTEYLKVTKYILYSIGLDLTVTE
jgi:hypothetical protein